MAEKQIAHTFSEQVDRLLAGQAAPHRPSVHKGGDDPLLSLAADLTPGAALDPSPAFVRRLRRQLLQSAPPRRALRLRRWSLAGVALSLFIALAFTMLWSPSTLSAAEVLARAADAVAVNPGQIEYIVLKADSLPAENRPARFDNPPPGFDNLIAETWNLVAAAPDERIIIAESAWTVYALNDTRLDNPLYYIYSAPPLFCFDTLAADLPQVPELQDCITLDPVSGGEPGPAARYAAESLQDWVARMQASEAEIEFHETEFYDRPVYSLTYLEASQHFLIAADSPSGGTGVVEEAYSSMDTVTVHIDRETYLPLGRVQHNLRPDTVPLSHVQTVLQYQVLDPAELDFDPFAWPPER